jgi:hypothetical protein
MGEADYEVQLWSFEWGNDPGLVCPVLCLTFTDQEGEASKWRVGGSSVKLCGSHRSVVKLSFLPTAFELLQLLCLLDVCTLNCEESLGCDPQDSLFSSRAICACATC